MWRTPKTDWHGGTSGGKYAGDYFNADDFNRIRDNLSYLYDLGVELYGKFDKGKLAVGQKSVGDFFYADELNRFEGNLNIINGNTLKRDYGYPPEFEDNGASIGYVELNRLEKAILDIHDRLENQAEGRRMFQWNFGDEGGL